MDLERRKFIKLGIAASAGVAASGLFGIAGYTITGRHVSRTTSNFHSHIDTVCQICPAGCGIRAFLDKYDNLVTLVGIPEHPVNKGKICARGMAAINLHYHPERILNSLTVKRNRGEGFAGISYEKAIEKTAGMIRSAKNKNALFVVDTQDQDPEPYHSIFEMFQVDYKIISRPIAKIKARKKIDALVYESDPSFSAGDLVQPDMENARTILVFGANPFEGGDYYIAQAKSIIDARINNEAQLFVFDPVNTNTAGKADRWLPVHPGTDYVAALYLLKLVKKNLTESDAALFEGLSEERACEITGLTPDDFTFVAKKIRNAGNTSIIVGKGIYRQADAAKTRLALANLENAAGGKPFFAKAVCPDPDSYTVDLDKIENLYEEEIIKGNQPVFLITRRSNPVYEGFGKSLENVLQDSNKLVGHFSICSFINETNRFADVIIPEKLPLEDWGIVQACWHAQKPTWTLSRPIPKSPSTVKSGYEVFMDLVSQLGSRGLAQHLGASSMERTQFQIRNLGLSPVSQKMNYLLEGKAEVAEKTDLLDTEKTLANLNENPGEKPSSKIKLLPIGAMDKFSKSNQHGEMTLVIYDTNVMDTDLANCKWLGEIAHRNFLKINQKDASKLGIKQGDKVKVESGGKSMVVPADLCQSVARKVCAMAAGFGHEHFGKVAAGKNWRSDDPDAWLIWWGQNGNGHNANQLTMNKSIKVKVTKA